MSVPRRYSDNADPSQNGRPVDELERGLHRAHAAIARIAEAVFDGHTDEAVDIAVAADLDLDVMLWRIHGDALAERRRQAAIDDATAAVRDVDADAFAEALERMDPADARHILDMLASTL